MDPRDHILTRMYLVLALLALVPLLVGMQMLRIHWGQGDELRTQGARQAESYVEIPAMRGAILDRAGRTLAVNTARYDLAVDPKVPGFADRKEALVATLARTTGARASLFRRRIDGRRSPRYALLARGLTERQKDAVVALGVPGVLLEERFGRRYNYGSLGAHVLGHVGAGGEGLAGVELQYDEHLRGIPGRRAVQRDRRGVVKAVVGGAVEAPDHGENVVLTIDLIRQTILEEELAAGVEEAGAAWGTAVAMDPHTGAILAMASVPTYDPNRPAAFETDARRNRAVTDRIEPGSTFKLISAIAAVESGVIAMHDSVDTGAGYARFGGRPMRDTHAYGTIPFTDVIALSSNVGTARTIQGVDDGAFYQYARNLGFGQPTGIDLPGEIGGRLKKPAEWSGTSKTSMSIGYEVEVTALQIAAAYAALANGGVLVQPHVVAERQDLTGEVLWQARPDSIRRAFERVTADSLLPAFERVVTDGTAKQAAVEGIRVAGKTGTAQKVVDGRYSRYYRASFAGFFPAEAPEVVLVVILDSPKKSIYGGVVSAPIFQRTAARWRGTFESLVEEAPAPAPALLRVPDVTGLPAPTAAQRLRAAGLDVGGALPTGAPSLSPPAVAAQRPAPGSAVDPGTRVRLEFAAAAATDSAAAAAATMPDVRGLDARSAVRRLAALGIDVQLDGHGLVERQTPAPGAPLPETASLILH